MHQGRQSVTSSVGSQKQKLPKQRNSSTLNIYLNGPQCSGKTSIIQQLLTQKFIPNPNPTTTQHFDYSLAIPNSSQTNYIKVNIWDLGGCPKYQKIRITTIKNKSQNKIQLLVYDVTDRNSFNVLGKYVDEWKNNGERSDVAAVILVANKIDLESQRKRIISTQDGLQFASKYNIVYAECSAKEYVGHLFLSAYYLHQSLSFKSKTIPSSLENYLIKLNQFVTNVEKSKQIYKMQESKKIRQIWQIQVSITFIEFLKLYKRFQKDFENFFKSIMDQFQAALQYFEQLKKICKQVKSLQLLIDFIRFQKSQKEAISQGNCKTSKLCQSTMTDDQKETVSVPGITWIRQQQKNGLRIKNSQCKQHQYYQVKSEIISNTLSSAPQQQAQHLYELLINKKQELTLVLTATIYTNKKLIQQQKENFVKKIQQMKQKCISSATDKFIVDLQKTMKTNESQQANIRDSIEIRNQKHLDDKKFKQQLNNICENVQAEKEVLNKLKDIISGLEVPLEDLDQAIKNEYANLQHSDSEVAIEFQTFTSLLDFYIENSFQTLEQIQISQEQPDKNIKYFKTKMNDINKSLNQKFEEKRKQINLVVDYLKKQIIEDLQICRKLKILKHQRNILNHWADQQVQKNIKEEQGSKFFGFFSKLFH